MSINDTLEISPIRSDKTAGKDEAGGPERYAWTCTVTHTDGTHTVTECRTLIGLNGLQCKYPDEIEWETISTGMPWLCNVDSSVHRRKTVIDMFREALDSED